MESQLVTVEKLHPFMPLFDLPLELVHEKLNLIYQEILSIEAENPQVKFNKNISFVNKIYRNDPLIIQALKCIYIGDCILKNRMLSPKELYKIAVSYCRVKEKEALRRAQMLEVKRILKNTCLIDTFYNAVAASSYYKEFKENKTFNTFFGTYKITAVIETIEGLRAIYFEPRKRWDRVVYPILSVRGTVADNPGNALDDLSASIGSIAFNSGRLKLFELFKMSLSKFPEGCVVVGHSLGGAIAQQMAAAFKTEGFISQVYHYNAPGVGSIAEAYIENGLNIDLLPQIIEVRHQDDLYSFFGGSHLPPSLRVIVKDQQRVTYDVAHEILMLMEKSDTESVQFEMVKKPEELKFWAGRFDHFTLETVRWVFAPILRLFVNIWFTTPTPISSNLIEEITEENLFIQKHQL